MVEKAQVTCFKFCENIYSTKSFMDLIRIIVVTGEEYESWVQVSRS